MDDSAFPSGTPSATDLRALLQRDALTGLNDAAAFEVMVADRQRAGGGDAAIGLIELHGLARYNDFQGRTQGDELKGNKGESTVGSHSQPKAIVPVWVQVTIVVGFLFLGFASEHYHESRSLDLFHAHSVHILSDTETSQSKHGSIMLTSEEDDQLEYHTNGQRFHVIFSTDCSSYQHWQRYECSGENCCLRITRFLIG